MTQSLHQQIKQIETVINRKFLVTDELDSDAREASMAVKKSMMMARSYIRDYELLDDDLYAQASILPEAIECLEKLRTDILNASQHNLIGAIDVAQLTAQLEQILERLR
ncbi:MAG: hypothetical protein JWL85_860 [Candidatus Saccharibacteria bacterium]|nr:hypothetical protein [Candidatus Saccharibacteria bacterium]